ncbi:MAG: Gfo/Idh/MocA family oxidoreductase [Gemmatimonadota bacterium]|nr:Gfo/Idh/MocA family oxidoreductase [Gemmatimonadota bacterium]
MVGGGPGAFIGAVHRTAAALDGEYELVAGAFASQPGPSREQGRLLGLDARRTYDSFHDMARGEAALGEDRRIDAVSVVTPNHLHHPVATAFLSAGFHVICDKPMTTTLADAEDLCRTVETTGLTFALTHNYTGYPMVREARQLVGAGRLGTVRKVVAEYPQGWLATRLEKTGHKQASWRQDPARAGASSAVADIGSHVHSLVRYVTGLEIGEIFAELSSLVPGRLLEDDATMLVRFVGGARGVYLASQISTGEENGLTLRVYGEEAGMLWRQERPNELRLMPAKGPRETFTRGSPGLSPAARHATRLPPGHPEGFIEAFANIYRGAGRVIGAAIGGREADPLDHDFPDHNDGAQGMHFIESVLESAAAGRWVDMAGYRP